MSNAATQHTMSTCRRFPRIRVHIIRGLWNSLYLRSYRDWSLCPVSKEFKIALAYAEHALSSASSSVCLFLCSVLGRVSEWLLCYCVKTFLLLNVTLFLTWPRRESCARPFHEHQGNWRQHSVPIRDLFAVTRDLASHNYTW